MEDNRKELSYYEKATTLRDKRIDEFIDMLMSDSDTLAPDTADNPPLHFGHRRRMRDGFRHDRDLNAMSDIEILEAILSFAVPQHDTNPTAHTLISSFTDLLNTLRATKDELLKIPYITSDAAELLSSLGKICFWHDANRVNLSGHFDAARFLASIFRKHTALGIVAVYLSKDFNVLSVECHDPSNPSFLRDLAGSACKYDTAYTVLAGYSPDFMPEIIATTSVAVINESFKQVGISMLDFFVFSDYGYYTLGDSLFNSSTTPNYVFVPLCATIASPDLAEKITPQQTSEYFDLALDTAYDFVGDIDAEPLPSLAPALLKFSRSVREK